MHLFGAPWRAGGKRYLFVKSSPKEDLPNTENHGYTDNFADGMTTSREEFDPLAPQREAAFFYGLFLRGHSIEALRQDIDVPRSLFDKWMRAHDFAPPFRESLQKVYAYRKQVLAIFEGLILNEQNHARLQ